MRSGWPSPRDECRTAAFMGRKFSRDPGAAGCSACPAGLAAQAGCALAMGPALAGDSGRLAGPAAKVNQRFAVGAISVVPGLAAPADPTRGSADLAALGGANHPGRLACRPAAVRCLDPWMDSVACCSWSLLGWSPAGLSACFQGATDVPGDAGRVFQGSAKASDHSCKSSDWMPFRLQAAPFCARQSRHVDTHGTTALPGVTGKTMPGYHTGGQVTWGPLGACRTWNVESENRPQRGQFLPDLQAHSPAMGQKDGEKWTAAVDLQPTLSKSDRTPRVPRKT
jgi:hypothetical protein